MAIKEQVTAAPRTDHPRKSPLSRLGDRLTKTVTQMEADELQEDAARMGCTPMCDLQDRQEATVDTINAAFEAWYE